MKKTLTLLTAAIVTGCATSQPPLALTDVKKAVDTRATYSYYTGWDKTILQTGQSGNCSAFAFTYAKEAGEKGVPLFVQGCTLSDGQGHAIAVTFDKKWALDIRQRAVVPIQQTGCK